MASDEATLIDAAAVVEGRLTGRDARVLGRFKGDVKLEGRLVLGVGARLEANVEAASAEIGGSFQGELHVQQLTLLETANVEGSVNAKALSIQEGAVINGSVNSGTGPAPVAPKPIPATEHEESAKAAQNAEPAEPMAKPIQDERPS
jgi:cytoskeletal protein CcmA (bactofilin family)